MVACDNRLGCVGLTAALQGEWFCTECKLRLRKQLPTRQLITSFPYADCFKHASSTYNYYTLHKAIMKFIVTNKTRLVEADTSTCNYVHTPPYTTNLMQFGGK